MRDIKTQSKHMEIDRHCGFKDNDRGSGSVATKKPIIRAAKGLLTKASLQGQLLNVTMAFEMEVIGDRPS